MMATNEKERDDLKTTEQIEEMDVGQEYDPGDEILDEMGRVVTAPREYEFTLDETEELTSDDLTRKSAGYWDQMRRKFQPAFDEAVEVGIDVPDDFEELRMALVDRAREIGLLQSIKSRCTQVQKTMTKRAKDKKKAADKLDRKIEAEAKKLGKEIEQEKAIVMAGGVVGGTTITCTLPKEKLPDGTEREIYPRLDCEGYIVSDKGVYDVLYPLEPICLKPLIPVARLKDRKEKDEQIIVAWRDIDVNTKKVCWNEHMIKRTIIPSETALAAELSTVGVPVDASTKRALSRYLNRMVSSNEKKLPFRKSVKTMGWQRTLTDDGMKLSFAPYGKEYEVDSEGPYKHTILPATLVNGDPKRWHDFMLYMRKKKRIEFLSMLAATYAAPLVSLLDVNGFALELAVGSGFGKTVASLICGSVIGDPTAGSGVVKTYRSSLTGIEETCAGTQNLALFLDDSKNINKDIEDHLEDILYWITNGSGKTRGQSSGGTRKTKSWALAGVLTGESPMYDKLNAGGARGRIYTIVGDNTIPLLTWDDDASFFPECEKVTFVDDEGKPLTGEKKKKAQKSVIMNTAAGFAKKNFGHGIREWIEAIIKLGEDELKQRYYKWQIKVSSGYSERSQKQRDIAAVVLLADELIEELIYHDDVRLPYEDFCERMRYDDDVDDDVRAYKQLQAKISANPARFVTNQDGTLKDENARATQEQWGYWPSKGNGEVVYLFPSGLAAALEGMSTTPTRFARWLEERGLLISGSEGFQIKASYGGQKRNVYAVNIACADPRAAKKEDYVPKGESYAYTARMGDLQIWAEASRGECVITGLRNWYARVYESERVRAKGANAEARSIDEVGVTPMNEIDENAKNIQDAFKAESSQKKAAARTGSPYVQQTLGIEEAQRRAEEAQRIADEARQRLEVGVTANETFASPYDGIDDELPFE